MIHSLVFTMTNGNPSSVIIKQHCSRSYALSWKPCQGDSLNLPNHRIHKDGDGDASFQLKSDSLPHAHAQSTKTFYKHQDSRIMKAQELKTKTSAQTLIYKIFLQRYQVYQGRLLASFQDDAKYEHVGQDTRSQGGKDDQDKQGKDLKISDIKTKSKDNDKGSRSKITKHEGTSLQRIQRPRPQDLNDKSNLIDLMKECHNELTSGEIVSLKILSQTRNFHQFKDETLADSWLYMKKAFRILILEDKVLLKLDFSDDSKNNPKPKNVVSTSGSNINPDHAILVDKFEALATKIYSEFLIIRKVFKEMRDNHRDNEVKHASDYYMKDDTLICKPRKANYIQGYHDQKPIDSYSYLNHNPNHKFSHSPNRTPQRYFELPKISMEEMMREWMARQTEANEQMKN
ncbi:hypothetical protein Tco_0313700 [Tanacetum coccineum]